MAVTGTSTVREIVTDALLDIGVGTIGQSAEASELAIGMRHLNRMLKAWQGDGSARFLVATQSLTLTTATSYSLTVVRPLRILNANYKKSGIETPMLELTRDEYTRLPDKAVTGQPTQYYFDRQKEAATFKIWPGLAAASGETIEITYEREFEDVTDETATIDLPAEWYDAVVMGLSARLCAPFQIDMNSRMIAEQKADMAMRKAAANDVEESVYWTRFDA